MKNVVCDGNELGVYGRESFPAFGDEMLTI